MTLDLDELRAAVAARHDTLLGKNDPIMVAVTLHDLVLGEYLRRTEETASRLDALSAARMTQEIAGVKTAAEGLIGGASKYAADEIRKAAHTAQATFLEAVDRRLAIAEKAQHIADKAVRTAVIAAAVCVGASLIGLGALIAAFVMK